jgi:Xaa-Pro aminopeptidase
MPPIFDLETLPPMDVAGRLPRLRERLSDAGCDGLLVTKLEHLRYLTGFTGSAGMLLVAPSATLLTTDSRYRDQATEQVEAAGVEVEFEVSGLQGQLDRLAEAAGAIGRIGLEATSVTWSMQLRLVDVFERSTVVATRGLVEALRAVKDPGEQARIEAACDVADVAIAQVKPRLAEGCTEAEFAAELEAEMRRRGASGPSFETIVASGPNSAMPHARPSERVIGPGELVVIDFGATVDGYRSDMTRTICVGELAEDLVRLVDAVFASQRAGLRAVAEGVSGGEVDEACREVLEEAGYGPAFLHSTGHGVGLEIHESPAVAKGSTDILAAGAVVTVEPGAYLAGRGGVRIEDTVLVGATSGRPLTKSTKDYTL